MVQQATLPPLVRGEWFPMTYEEFLAWAPEGMRTEWRDGEGIVYMTTGDRHQALVLFASSLLDVYTRVFGLGRVRTAPYPMELRPGGPHREPDVMSVANARLDRMTEQRLRGPADLLFEFLSEDTAREDRGRKRDDYEKLGVPEYIMADARPRRFDFEYLRRNESGRYQPVEPDDEGRYHSAVLPGFWLRPDWFRQDPLPDVEDLMLKIAPDAFAAWLIAKLRASGKM
jgi:Uma2 family endonuclease